MRHPESLRYSKSHEWVRVEGDRARVGITDYAQAELGDIVFLELSKVGRRLAADEEFGTVESVKAASELYSPVAGEIVEANEALTETPEQINEDPYEAGWMLVVRLDDPAQVEGLMTAAQYEELLRSG